MKMTSLRHILLGSLLIWSLSFFAFDRITLVGDVKLETQKLGLMEVRFGFAEKLVDQTHIRACEAIDNSMMVVFSDIMPAASLEEWFGNEGIRKSLHELLRRNGVIYFGGNSWTNLKEPLARTRAFFRERGMEFPGAGNIGDFPHPVIKDFPKDSQPVLESKAAFLNDPYDFTKAGKDPNEVLTSIRYFKDWKAPGLETFFQTAEGEPTIMGFRQAVEEKGTVIFCFCFSPVRARQHHLFENLIKYAYGELKILTDTEVAAQNVAKLLGKNGDKAAVPALPALPLAADAASAPKLSCANHKEGKPVQLATEVQVFGDEHGINVHFRCQAPDADKVVNKFLNRDENIWSDDAVSIMFAPDGQQPVNHLFLVNSSGALYDARGGNSLWNSNAQVATRTYPDHWECDFSLDPAELGVKLDQGGYVLFNAGREGTPTGEVTSVYPGYNDPAKYAILGIGDEQTLTERYAEAHKPLSADTPYIVWHDNPYRKKYTTSMPEKAMDCGNVAMTVARNDQEAMGLFITNLSDKALTFRLEPDFLLDNGTPFRELLEVKEAIPRLDPLGQPLFDAISRLNEAGTVTIPCYETKMLWLDVKTQLPPGTYQWNLECVPTTTRDVRKKFHLTVEVLDYALPETLRAESFGFGPYLFSYAEGKRDEYYKVWREHHMTHVIIGVPVENKAAYYDEATGKVVVSDNLEDYSMDEDWLLANGWKWFYSYGTYWPFRDMMAKTGKEMTIADPEFRELYGRYLRNWAAYLRKHQIPFDRFYVGICDEVRPEHYDEYAAAGLFMKEVVPEFQIFGTLATWFDQEQLPRFAEFMDLFVPWEPRLTDRASGKEELKFYQTCGKRFMPYLCSVNLPLQNMQTYCRFRGIRTYLMGSDFVSQWGFNSWRQNEWFSSVEKNSWHSFMFYHGTDGPIVCPRMEAYREAVEDLHLLLEASEVQKQSADKELGKLIDPQNLQNLMKADDVERTHEWRTALLRRLAALQK